MSNAVALKPDSQVPAFTPAQEKLLLDTVAKGATPDEFKLFLYRAQAMGLNPLTPGQIHFVKYGNSPGSIVVGIEGFRSIAQRTGVFAGIKRGTIKDATGKLLGAWAEVHRKDWEHPAREEVSLAEYQGTSPIWRKMPETMIKKVAECAALRMAFPNDLGGVYGHEEEGAIEASSSANHSASQHQPTEADGVIDGPYRIDFGSYPKLSIEELCERIGKEALMAEVEKRENELAGKAKSMIDMTNPEKRVKVQRFIDEASAYIVSLENGPAVDEPETAEFAMADSGSLFDAKPKLSRSELGKLINAERVRLKMTNQVLATMMSTAYKKTPDKLTDDEMASLLEELSRRSA